MRGRACGTYVTYLTRNIANNAIPWIWSLGAFGQHYFRGASIQYMLRSILLLVVVSVVPLPNLVLARDCYSVSYGPATLLEQNQTRNACCQRIGLVIPHAPRCLFCCRSSHCYNLSWATELADVLATCLQGRTW